MKYHIPVIVPVLNPAQHSGLHLSVHGSPARQCHVVAQVRICKVLIKFYMEFA